MDPLEPLYDGEVIDTHQHLWDLEALNLPWLGQLTGQAQEILGRSYLLHDYAAATLGLQVRRAVYMEVDVAEAQQLQEVEFVTKVCADVTTPTVAAVVSGRPAAAGFSDYLNRLDGKPFIKGLRQVLHTPATPARFCVDDRFVQGVRLLGERGFRFDLCVRNDQLDDVAELVDRCPQTRFILDHCGNPHKGSLDLEGWRKGLAQVAGAGNVMCKISGLYAHVAHDQWPAERLAPIVRAAIDEFGWDRVLFAGDWPVVNLGASFRIWLEAVKHIVRDDKLENQRKLFRDNAVQFYGLA